MLIHELVARQASAAPGAVAVIGEKQLTYGELDSRADRLARRLVSLGVRSEVPVALFLERSPELAIAALAVLKAGGAYVPLDPSYPLTRIADAAGGLRRAGGPDPFFGGRETSHPGNGGRLCWMARTRSPGLRSKFQMTRPSSRSSRRVRRM